MGGIGIDLGDEDMGLCPKCGGGVFKNLCDRCGGSGRIPLVYAGAVIETPRMGAELETASGGGWRPMSEAPRDGRPIEVRCTFGVAPWFGLYRWTDDVETKIYEKLTEDGAMVPVRTVRRKLTEPRWAQVDCDDRSFEEGPHFTWRPYQGDPEKYVDPTNGLQDRPEYWRAAVARKLGQGAMYDAQVPAYLPGARFWLAMVFVWACVAIVWAFLAMQRVGWL